MKEFDRKYVSDQAQERYDDASFAMLMDGYAAKLGEEQIAENERLQRDGCFEFPAGLDEKCLKAMDRAFSEKRRRSRRAKIIRIAKKAVVAAASMLLVVCLSSVVLYHTVEAFRVKVVDYAIEFLDIGDGAFVSIKSNEEKSGADVVPTWLPDGYQLVEENNIGEAYIAKYSNGKSTVRYTAKKLNSAQNIDTEDADFVYERKINGKDAVVTLKEGVVMLCWYDYEKGYIYSLWADGLDMETVTDIAESCYK